MDWETPLVKERKIKLLKVNGYELTFNEKWFFKGDIITNDNINLKVELQKDKLVIIKPYRIEDMLKVNIGDYFKIKR